MEASKQLDHLQSDEPPPHSQIGQEFFLHSERQADSKTAFFTPLVMDHGRTAIFYIAAVQQVPEIELYCLLYYVVHQPSRKTRNASDTIGANGTCCWTLCLQKRGVIPLLEPCKHKLWKRAHTKAKVQAHTSTYASACWINAGAHKHKRKSMCTHPCLNYVCTCRPSYMRKYIHTCVHMCLPTYLTYPHTYIRAYARTYGHTCIHTQA